MLRTVGDAPELAFFATCRLAEQFLPAMAGVESMAVAINPADNSFNTVIELPLWMLRTTRDYSSQLNSFGLQVAAIVTKSFSRAASGVHSICILPLGRD